MGVMVIKCRRRQDGGRPSEQAYPRSPEVCGRTGLEHQEVWPASPCVGPDGLRIWPQGMLDGDLFDAEESGSARARHSTDC